MRKKKDWRARVEFEDGSVVETPVRFLCPKTQGRLRRSSAALWRSYQGRGSKCLQTEAEEIYI